MDAFDHVFKTLMETTISPVRAAQATKDGPRTSEPRALLDAIIFSRRFVLTYYIPIVIALLIAAVTHFTTRWKNQKQIRTNATARAASPQTVSSASSTLVGDEEGGLEHGVHAEHTPLLSSVNGSTKTHGTSPVARLMSRTRASLMWQPKPIPALTAPSNQLPPNGISFVVAFYFAVNVFYLFYDVSPSIIMFFAFADRAGLCFAVNLPVLYVLAAKNNQPLKWLTGWSYEKLNLLHRRLGEWMVFLGALHSVSMGVVWYTLIRPQGYSFGWFLTRPIIVLGIGALASFLILWATSTGSFRQRAYELFLVSHILFQSAALVLLFFHSTYGRPYCAAALAIWALDRIASRILISSRKYIATLEIAEDKKTVLLFCEIALDHSRLGDIRSGWKAGQHVFLTVPGIRWHHAYQAHPFTIASPAPDVSEKSTRWPLQLVIRCQDGFSKDLLEYARYHQHATIYLDGPYGSSDLATEVLSAQRTCLIAGGSGITVTYPLAWILHSKGKESSIASTRTIYHNGKKQATKVSLQTALCEERHAHFWIRQSSQNQSWLKMFPISNTGLLQLPTSMSDCTPCVNLVSRAYDTRSGTSDRRPDIATEVGNWVRGEGKAMLHDRGRICMVVSGPDSLVREVRNCAAALVREGYNIELHVEKFGW